jgi:hypothetical protein
MMMPYVCEGTYIKTASGREGKVIGVDRKNKVALIHQGKTSYTEKLTNLSVVSYKEVE